MSEPKLVDRKTLGERHPYLSNRWRLAYLIRTGQIPVVKVGAGRGRYAFDIAAIDAWIEKRSRGAVTE